MSKIQDLLPVSVDVQELPEVAKALKSAVPDGIFDEVSYNDWADAKWGLVWVPLTPFVNPSF